MSHSRGAVLHHLLLLCVLLLSASPGPAVAQPLSPSGGQPETGPAPGSFQVRLLTYGPGDIYWQRFGHNALWLSEPAIGLDHAFNFGFFDFEQESFLVRFVQGRMLYFAAAIPVMREMTNYRNEQRSIRVQELSLSPQQYQRLRDHLLWHVQPGNRDYLYDYYLDNCSTRLRDALDIALNGALRGQFAAQAGTATFREHTRRSTAMDFWYYLGLEVALGVPVDQPIRRWDELFLPALLADALLEVHNKATASPLVLSDKPEFQGSSTLPAAQVTTTWPRYLLAGTGVLLLMLLLSRPSGAAGRSGLLLATALLFGGAGMVLLLLALFTDHAAASPNFNLLLFNPLLLLVLWRVLRPLLGVVLALSLGAATAIAITGLWQYNRDVVAFCGPLLAYLSWFLLRTHPAAEQRPRVSETAPGRASG